MRGSLQSPRHQDPVPDLPALFQLPLQEKLVECGRFDRLSEFSLIRLFLCFVERLLLPVWVVLCFRKCMLCSLHLFLIYQYVSFQSIISNVKISIPFASITAIKKKLSKWLVHDSIELSHQKYYVGNEWFPPQVCSGLLSTNHWSGSFFFLIFQQTEDLRNIKSTVGRFETP